MGIPLLIRFAVFVGNLKSAPEPASQKLIAPPPPTLDPLPEATNSAQIAVSGLSQPNYLVEVYLNQREAGRITSQSDGSFKNILTLSEGENEIYALAIDQEGNSSEPSGKIVVIYQTTPPDLEVTQPKDKENFISESNKIEVVGKTNPEASIWVNDHLVVVDKDGNFKYPLSLSLGENTIKVIAKDKAGNQTERVLTVSYSLY